MSTQDPNNTLIPTPGVTMTHIYKAMHHNRAHHNRVHHSAVITTPCILTLRILKPCISRYRRPVMEKNAG